MRSIGLVSEALEAVISRLAPQLEPEGLLPLFANTLRNTLATTVELAEDGTTFVITGDIPAMWLRDSTGQVLPYVRFCAADPLLRRVLRCLILRQARCLLVDPYANAFTRTSDGSFGFSEDVAEQRPGVWERKYELDSLCFPLRLLRSYVAATGEEELYREPEMYRAIQTILTTLSIEQHHQADSSYSFRRLLPGYPNHDTTSTHPVGFTGMIWSAFRPSDDGCLYHYPIASQMMAVVELRHLAAGPVPNEAAGLALRLSEEIEQGIRKYGVIEDPYAGRIYAYEVDGLGHALCMDDANIPSLLSASYLGYCRVDDELYLNTRRFLLSQANPYFYLGRMAEGIGSLHTPVPYVWPMALIVEALTTPDRNRVRNLISMLRDTDAGTGYIHESFDPNTPARYTRSWFAWANALFAELLFQHFGE
jgi:meiotically up-regulated gene 157 (Mug157) protein